MKVADRIILQIHLSELCLSRLILKFFSGINEISSGKKIELFDEKVKYSIFCIFINR